MVARGPLFENTWFTFRRVEDNNSNVHHIGRAELGNHSAEKRRMPVIGLCRARRDGQESSKIFYSCRIPRNGANNENYSGIQTTRQLG